MKIPTTNFVTCIPIVASDLNEAKTLIDSALEIGPDFIEFRFDSYEDSVEDLIKLLKEAKKHTGIIFTYRKQEEGGVRYSDNDERLRVIDEFIDNKVIDYIDVEMQNDKKFLDHVRTSSKDLDLILSNHDFNKLPEIDEILDRFNKALKTGDVIKGAYKVNDDQDIIDLIEIGHEFKSENPHTPLILIAMGDHGVISRVYPELFNSNLIFISNLKGSAPGQLSYNNTIKLREKLNLI